MFKVEIGHPIPTKTKGAPRGNRAIYPFANLKFGESFLVPADCSKKVRDAAKHYRARTPGWDYICQYQDGGLRVWRTK